MARILPARSIRSDFFIGKLEILSSFISKVKNRMEY